MESNTINIIDNFLSNEEYRALVDAISPDNFFPYYLNNSVNSYATPQQINHLDNYYFAHVFYEKHRPNSPFLDCLTPILNKLDVRALIRIKLNLYPRTHTLYEHAPHVDTDWPSKGAIYYVNSNDGFTRVGKDRKVESVANRIMFTDLGQLHNSTTCTNEKYRITINFNYL